MGERGRRGHAGAWAKGCPEWVPQHVQKGGQGVGKKGKSAHLELVHDATVLALTKAALRRMASCLYGDFWLFGVLEVARKSWKTRGKLQATMRNRFKFCH